MFLCNNSDQNMFPKHEGLDGGGGGVWYSLLIKNLAHNSIH